VPGAPLSARRRRTTGGPEERQKISWLWASTPQGHRRARTLPFRLVAGSGRNRWKPTGGHHASAQATRTVTW